MSSDCKKASYRDNRAESLIPFFCRPRLQIRVTVDEEEFEDGKNFRLQDVRSMVDVTASVPQDSSSVVAPI